MKKGFTQLGFLIMIIGILSGCSTDNGTNHSPVAYDQNITLNEDSSAEITLKAHDDDGIEGTYWETHGDGLDYIIVSQPQHGELRQLTDKTRFLNYTPQVNYHGTDSFQFKVYDGKEYSNVATVWLTIKSVNDRPSADPKNISMDQNSRADILLSGSDTDDTNLGFFITTNPAHGTVSLDGSNAIYTPDAGFYGFDLFEYVSNDGELNSTRAKVKITVTERAFKFKVDTSIPGASGQRRFAIPANISSSGVEYKYAVDCNDDGVIDARDQDGIYICVYNHDGNYTISIRGKFPQIFFNNNGDKDKVVSIEEWGTHLWSSFDHAFAGCSSMESNATDKPNLSNVEDLSYMFENASSFDGKVEDWNTSNIQKMNGMFKNASGFSGHDLSGWDVGQVSEHNEFCDGWGSGNTAPDSWSCQ